MRGDDSINVERLYNSGLRYLSSSLIMADHLIRVTISCSYNKLMALT